MSPSLPPSSSAIAESSIPASQSEKWWPNMDFPSSPSDGADCASVTPILWSLSFLGERGCDVLQVGIVGPAISLYPLPAMMGDQTDCVFQMSQRLKTGSESWSKWSGRANGSSQFFWKQVENTMSKLNGCLSCLWCLLSVFYCLFVLRVHGVFLNPVDLSYYLPFS